MGAWKGRLLNKAGKVCLARAVTMSIPIYSMQTHLLPKSVCDHVDSMTLGFIRGAHGNKRSWSLVNWEWLPPRENMGDWAFGTLG